MLCSAVDAAHARKPVCGGGAGSLSLEGRQAVCRALVAEGKAEWASKDSTTCIVTVQPVQQWASTIHTVVRTRFTTSIVMIEELHSGDDARGTGMLPPHPPCIPAWYARVPPDVPLAHVLLLLLMAGRSAIGDRACCRLEVLWLVILRRRGMTARADC